MTCPTGEETKWEVRPRVLFIQCKRQKSPKTFNYFLKDKVALITFARQFGAEAAFAMQVDRKAWLEWILPESQLKESI